MPAIATMRDLSPELNPTNHITGIAIRTEIPTFADKDTSPYPEKDKYTITCGIFGLEKIMDDIAKGNEAKIAIAKFIHGIAYNAWQFAKKPEKLYLSGGFCENKCFVDSLSNYCEVALLGRFLLCEGLFK